MFSGLFATRGATLWCYTVLKHFGITFLEGVFTLTLSMNIKKIVNIIISAGTELNNQGIPTDHKPKVLKNKCVSESVVWSWLVTIGRTRWTNSCMTPKVLFIWKHL